MTWYHGKTWREISVLFPTLAKNDPSAPMSDDAAARIAEVTALCRIALAAENIAAWMDPNTRRIAIKMHAEKLASERRWRAAREAVGATFGKCGLHAKWLEKWVTVVGESMEAGTWNEHRTDLVALAKWGRMRARTIGPKSMEQMVEQATAVGGVAKVRAAADGALA